jgi:uncharacterized protein YdeI (YjbR/CyaY-like superfamily)
VEVGETLYAASREDFRKWLAEHHQSKQEIWLVFYRKSSGKPTIPYDDAVEKAICYGWIDSQQKPIDAERLARRFTPRRKQSEWSKYNKARALKMLREGRMTRAGMAVLPTEVLRRWNEQK